MDSQPFIHSHALVDERVVIGARTRVWAFAHVLAGARIGEDCNICDHTFIEGNVVIGNRVTVKCGVYLWDGLVIDDDVFIGPAAVFTNDMLPRSRRRPASYLETRLKQGCSIGAGAVLCPGVTIGRWSMVGAGSVVTRDVAAHALVVGNPARFRKWICRCANELRFDESGRAQCECDRTYQRIDEAQVEERETVL